jgi:hypothetical protein
MYEDLSGWVETIQTCTGRYPNLAGVIFQQAEDEVPAYAVWILRIVVVFSCAVAIVPSQPALGPKPQEALIVFDDVANSAVRGALTKRDVREAQVHTVCGGKSNGVILNAVGLSRSRYQACEQQPDMDAMRFPHVAE